MYYHNETPFRNYCQLSLFYFSNTKYKTCLNLTVEITRLITVRTVRILELTVESSDLNIKWRSVTATFPSLIHKNAISLKSP